MANRHTLPVLLLAAALLAQGAAAQTPVRPAQFIVQPNTPSQFLNGVAMDGAGNLTFLWTSIAGTPSGLGERVYVRRFSAADAPQGRAVSLEDPSKFNAEGGGVVANQRGDVLITWSRSPVSGSGPVESFLRRTSPVLPTLTLSLKAPADVAVDRNGNFVIIWIASTSSGTRIFGQRYNNAGERLGAQLLIAQEYIPDSHPQVAMSPQGDFVVAWDDQGTSPAWFRLLRADGTPAGPVVEQPPMGTAFYHGTGRVTFGWNRTFVYGWTNYLDEGPNGNTISFQRFMASP